MLEKDGRVRHAFLKLIIRPWLWLKVLGMHAIVFYQKHLSRHTCLYEPTCSEYTLRTMNNLGFFAGVILGSWRILRCNPLSRGGYDPAPENHFKYKWVL